MSEDPQQPQPQERPKRKKNKPDGQPQGQTNPSRDMHSDDDVQVKDQALARDMRLVPDAGEEVGEGEVQEKMDKEQANGFRGLAADPTPNENYTVAGVTSDAPTPETHFGQRRAAKDARTLNEGVESL